jgi:hypothetical protein
MMMPLSRPALLLRRRSLPASVAAPPRHAPYVHKVTSQAPAGLERSARVREQGGHLFETVLARAVRLKALKSGGGGDAT